jgi:hypothetical protein
MDIVHLFALAGLIGLASERRTGLSETDIVPQIFFDLLGQQGPARDLGPLLARNWSAAVLRRCSLIGS